MEISLGSQNSRLGSRPRLWEIGLGFSEFKTRVSASASGDRPRIWNSRLGSRPRLWEIGLGSRNSRLGSRPRLWEAGLGSRPRPQGCGRPIPPFRESVLLLGIFCRNSEARVSASAEGDICTPHSQRVSFAPQIFCRVTRDFSRNFSFRVATLGIFLHKMRTRHPSKIQFIIIILIRGVRNLRFGN
jgi:hypothetical protein